MYGRKYSADVFWFVRLGKKLLALQTIPRNFAFNQSTGYGAYNYDNEMPETTLYK